MLVESAIKIFHICFTIIHSDTKVTRIFKLLL
jgi:hypothetical protein